MKATSRPSETLRSKRENLVRLRMDFAPVIFAAVDADRERLGRFLPWVARTRTLEDEIFYIRAATEQWERGEYFDYAIFLRADGSDTGEYLGNVGVHSIAWEHERCEIGYWVKGSREGQGLIAEAVSEVESEVFRLGFNRIEICCSSENSRSARVPERLGYRLEGIMRQDSIENGRYRDTLVHAKLRSDRAGAS